jgi:hypothetical protein
MSELATVYKRDFEQTLRERELCLQIMGTNIASRVALAYVPVKAGKPKETITALQGMTPQWPIAVWGYASLSWAYFVFKDYEKAKWGGATVKKILEAVPSASLEMFRELHFTLYPGALDRELAALRKAGLLEKQPAT